MKILSTAQLSVGYHGVPLLEHVDLELHPGELVALLGVNGGGKSTLLKTMTGQLPALTGTIELDGRPMGEQSAFERARRMAVVLTDRPRAGLLDVRTLVALGRQPWTGHFGRLSAVDLSAVERAMELLDIARFADRSLDQLSDGELQRVLIARALAQDTPLIFLDEPTAFLDLVQRVKVMRILRDLANKEGKAVLLSTHDLGTALDLCDRVFLITGRMVWSGTVAQARLEKVLERTFAAEGMDPDIDFGIFRAK